MTSFHMYWWIHAILTRATKHTDLPSQGECCIPLNSRRGQYCVSLVMLREIKKKKHARESCKWTKECSINWKYNKYCRFPSKCFVVQIKNCLTAGFWLILNFVIWQITTNNIYKHLGSLSFSVWLTHNKVFLSSVYSK